MTSLSLAQWNRYLGIALASSYVVVKTMPPRVREFKDSQHVTWNFLEHKEGLFLTCISGMLDERYDLYHYPSFEDHSLRRRVVIHETRDGRRRIAIPRAFYGDGCEQRWIEIDKGKHDYKKKH